jgi:glutamine amidotransferase
MSVTVTIVDYGLGNLFSVSRAIEHVGAEALVSAAPLEIERATHLVLPGVGAFSDGMTGLRDRGLVDPIRRFGLSGRPLLGICLGMQLLFDLSEEFGRHEGLGLIPGKIVAIPTTGADGAPHKIPHVGWNELLVPQSRQSWDDTVLADVTPGSSVYFVHSFTADPAEPADRLADCLYDGRLISAAVNRGYLSGCQFHPEKSAAAGLRILRRFIGAPS